jgi:hypothetical protein
MEGLNFICVLGLVFTKLVKNFLLPFLVRGISSQRQLQQLKEEFLQLRQFRLILRLS